jgi:hypothetical protein
MPLSQFGCDASSVPYAKGSREAKSVLAGGQNFKLDEIEVL